MKPLYKKQLVETINSENLLERVQRSPEAKVDDFLFETGHLISILKPWEQDEPRALCNLGCGNGLHNLVLSAFYGTITNVDVVSEMLDGCRHVCRNLDGMRYLCEQGDKLHEHFGPGTFDHVIIIGVAPVVSDGDELLAMLGSASRTLKRPGKVLIAHVNDLSLKDGYIGSLPEILRVKQFSESRIEQTVEKNIAANWTDVDQLSGFLTGCGASKISIYPENVQHIAHECQVDVLAEF